jgi:hypothetical protein
MGGTKGEDREKDDGEEKQASHIDGGSKSGVNAHDDRHADGPVREMRQGGGGAVEIRQDAESGGDGAEEHGPHWNRVVGRPACGPFRISDARIHAMFEPFPILQMAPE